MLRMAFINKNIKWQLSLLKELLKLILHSEFFKHASMTDIENMEHIKTFVNAFYNKVKNDDLLATVFESKISEEKWPAHLEKMYAFWNMIIFGDTAYKGQPFDKHVDLPVNNMHYQRWIELFHKTMDENFSGEKAESVKLRAAGIANVFSFKTEQMHADKTQKI